MKKYIVIPLLVFMFIFLLVQPCSAAENQIEAFTYENFEYHNNGNGITIDSYFGSEETVDIPAYIGNEQVTEIADYAFLLCNTVVTVNVPDSVTKVGDKAFSGASKLVNIHIVSFTKPDDGGESTEETITDDEEPEQKPSEPTPDHNGSEDEVSNESGQKTHVTEVATDEDENIKVPGTIQAKETLSKPQSIIIIVATDIILTIVLGGGTFTY